MRILKRDFKHGIVRLQAEDADDLWYLDGVVEPGDTVSMNSEWKLKLGGAEEKTKIARKRAYITLSVQKIELSDELRILGKITDGPEFVPRGNHHSFSVVPGSELTITKEWLGYQKEKLREAAQARSSTLVILFDREQAIILRLSGRAIEELSKLKGNVQKKGLDEQKQDTFYQDLIKQVEEYDVRLKPGAIVFASPAFWQEYVKKMLPDSLKRAAFTTISDVEKTAVKELLGRPELKSVLQDARAAQELGYVEEIMTALAGEKLAYGEADTLTAINEGNIKAVFITEKLIKKLREQERFKPVEAALRTAEQLKATVHLISSDDAMSKIDPLGGIVAMKRW